MIKAGSLLLRVTEVGRPAFRLRAGEEGISVFVPEMVDPALTEVEVLGEFRPGSLLVSRTVAEVEAKGLIVAQIEGATHLPLRLQTSHAEIRPAPTMSRTQVKQSLKELE